MVVRFFDFEKTAQDRLPAAAIEQISRVDGRFCALRCFDVDLHAIGTEIDPLHFGFFADFGAVFARMIEQNLIEVRACDLIGSIALGTETVLEIKLYSLGSASGDDFATEL